jgi:hypothetical protein
MSHPPPEMERGACQGAPNSISKPQPGDISQTPDERQTRCLRRRFAIGVSLAASLAPLIWGLPR